MEKQIKTNYVYHPVYVDSTSRNTERKIINDVFDKIIFKLYCLWYNIVNNNILYCWDSVVNLLNLNLLTVQNIIHQHIKRVCCLTAILISFYVATVKSVYILQGSIKPAAMWL